MEKEKTIKLVKKYMRKHIRNLPFVDGKVNKYILIASIDLCVEEEEYELASLFKKFIDIGYYDDPNSKNSKEIYEFLKKSEMLDNLTDGGYYESEEEFFKEIEETEETEETEDKKYIGAKIDDLESKLILNNKCINKLNNKIIKNPFNDDKFKNRFEYYRNKSLQNYYDDNIELNKNLEKLIDKFKKLKNK
jgi:uncharacterized coiled-coil protein SlyX